MRNFSVWSRDKRALSPIFATVLLATIIIVFGSVAYYYSSNITQTATNNYVKTLSDSQQAIAERIGFENVDFIQSSPSSPITLKIYIINCGSANNVKINTIFLYDANHNILPPPYSGTPSFTLKNIKDDTPITGNNLNVGQEAYFTVTLAATTLPSGYSIQLITQSGSTFIYAP